MSFGVEFVPDDNVVLVSGVRASARARARVQTEPPQGGAAAGGGAPAGEGGRRRPIRHRPKDTRH